MEFAFQTEESVPVVTDLAIQRNKLDDARNQIGDAISSGLQDAFRLASHIVNPYELIQNEGTRVLSRAYYKMSEFLRRYSVPCKGQNIHTVHLCEAPGAFVQAMQNYCERNHITNWTWKGVTLRDGLQWKADPSHIVYADILEEQQWDKNMYNADIVTGDGGFELESKDRNMQEKHNHRLFEAQVKHALDLVREGGHIFIKFFDMFNDETHQVLYDCYCHFEKVIILKPFGSRICNSERYVVGLRRLSRKNNDILDTPPAWFLKQCYYIARAIAERQTTSIQKALKLTYSIANHERGPRDWHFVMRNDVTSISRSRQCLRWLNEPTK